MQVSQAIPCITERTLGALLGLETYLYLTMTQSQLNHAATYQLHLNYLNKIFEEHFSKLFVKEQGAKLLALNSSQIYA